MTDCAYDLVASFFLLHIPMYLQLFVCNFQIEKYTVNAYVVGPNYNQIVEQKFWFKNFMLGNYLKYFFKQLMSDFSSIKKFSVKLLILFVSPWHEV